MNKILTAIAATLFFAAVTCTPVYAAEAAQGTGTVIKVDAASGIVNLSHEAILQLKWPAMTMDFKVTDKKLLAGLKPGQRVAFGLFRDASGAYLISRIEAQK